MEAETSIHHATKRNVSYPLTIQISLVVIFYTKLFYREHAGLHRDVHYSFRTMTKYASSNELTSLPVHEAVGPNCMARDEYTTRLLLNHQN
jgi:hypothetical protein